MKNCLHRLARLLIVWTFAALCFAVPGNRIRADDPIQIVSQTAGGKLGKTYDFSIVVKSLAGTIDFVYLDTAYPGELSTRYDLSPGNPAPQVTLHYSMDLSAEDRPPWQILLYSWEIADSAGNRITTPEASEEIVDKSRGWRKLTDEKVSVYYYSQSTKFGNLLLQATQVGYKSVARATGHVPQAEIRVVIYNNQKDFCTYHLVNGCLQWVGGETYPGITVQYLDKKWDPSNTALFNQTIPHELAHAFVAEWLGTNISNLPAWFNEGQAMNNEIDGLDPYLNRAVELAKDNQLWRLRAMGNPSTIDPSDNQKIFDWYAQAGSMVSYLFDRWGKATLGQIVGAMLKGKFFAAAFQDATGLTLDQFEAKWRAWVGAPKLVTPTPRPTATPIPATD